MFPVTDPSQIFGSFDFFNGNCCFVDAIWPEGIDQVQTRHCTNSRSGQIQQCNKHQCPTCGRTCVFNGRNRKETYDNVWQTCGTDHQRYGEQEHVQGGVGLFQIGSKAQIGHQTFQGLQQRCTSRNASDVRCGRREHTNRWDWVTSQLQRNKDCWNGVCNDQHNVLSNLRVGDALHAADNSVEENNRRTDQQTGQVINFQETRERNANAGHLTNNVGDRCNDQTDNCHGTCGLAVETVTNEFRHSELAEFAQIRCQQHRQQNVAAGPAHQVSRSVVAAECNNTSHRNERCCRHPVSAGCHAVDDRVNAATRSVEFRCGTRAGPDRDADVERKRRAHNQQVERKLIHCWSPYSSTPCSLSSLFIFAA